MECLPFGKEDEFFVKSIIYVLRAKHVLSSLSELDSVPLLAQLLRFGFPILAFQMDIALRVDAQVKTTSARIQYA